MADFDTNRLPRDSKANIRRTNVYGRGDASDPTLGYLLNESTPGTLGKNADRGMQVTGEGVQEPDVNCFWCIVLCMLDIPSSDIKAMWGDYLKANIAAQHYAGLPQEQAKERGLFEYLQDAKSIAKITKKLATFIVQGEIEITLIKVIAKPTAPISEKITISTHHFPPLEKLRWKIIALLTRKFSEEFIVMIFKKFAIGYNVLDWVLTVKKGTECTGKCVAAEVMVATRRVAKYIAEVQEDFNELMKGFFDWLAQEFSQAFAKTVKRLDPNHWKYADKFPPQAKQKIANIDYHFHLLALLPPTLDSSRQLSQTLPDLGVAATTINKVAEGIVDAFYAVGTADPNDPQKQVEITKMANDLKQMTPTDFVRYLEDQNFIRVTTN